MLTFLIRSLAELTAPLRMRCCNACWETIASTASWLIQVRKNERAREEREGGREGGREKREKLLDRMTWNCFTFLLRKVLLYCFFSFLSVVCFSFPFFFFLKKTFCSTSLLLIGFMRKNEIADTQTALAKIGFANLRKTSFLPFSSLAFLPVLLFFFFFFLLRR